MAVALFYLKTLVSHFLGLVFTNKDRGPKKWLEKTLRLLSPLRNVHFSTSGFSFYAWYTFALPLRLNLPHLNGFLINIVWLGVEEEREKAVLTTGPRG